MNRPALFLAVVSVVASSVIAFVAACTDNESTSTGSAVDASTIDASTPVNGTDGALGDDAQPALLTTCEQERAYTTDCNKDLPDGGEGLTCGDGKFDAWCALNDKAINSAAFRRGEAMCLTHANCDGDARKDCEYKTYATATPTTAQKQLALAYCQTCEPADPTGCVTRETTYHSALGPKSIDDVFVAVWELNDSLDDEIRTKCTGSAADAGATPDAGTCLTQFANCAGGIYVDHLPDCP